MMGPVEEVGSNVETTPALGGVTGRGFMPGRSGNPSGRPKHRHLTDMLGAELAKTASKNGQTREQRMIERLVTMAISGKRSEAIQAMKLIFAYRDGLPIQPIELELRRAAEQIAERTGADADWLVKRAQEIAAKASEGVAG